MKKYRAEGGVAVVPAMHRIDGDIRDELDMRHQQTDEQMMNTVHIVRPIAVRVNHALPVSQAETEEFYKQTEHLPLAQVHELFKESSEWYNYYTRNSFSPNAYMLDRELGARNPSPGDERKRRLSDEIRDNKDNDDCMVDSQQQQENDTPILIRPSPIRVHKPTALRVNHAIPKLIEEARREDQRCVSPITLYSSHSANAINRPNENNLLPRLICTQVNLVEAAKEGLLQALAVSGGETSAPEFTSNLDILVQNAQHQSPQGLWLTLTKPTFFDNLGENDSGDPMYTLARMSFDMFSPAQLVCSLQGNFNEVQTVQSHDVIVPKNLREEVSDQATVLQTYKYVPVFCVCVFIAPSLLHSVVANHVCLSCIYRFFSTASLPPLPLNLPKQPSPTHPTRT